MPRRALVVIASMLFSVLAPSYLPVAHASTVRDLRSALLRSSEAPAGFSHPVYRVYTRYVPTMQLRLVGNAGATCTIDARYKRYGWKQAIIQAFRPAQKNVIVLYQLCGYLFSTSRGAQRAWADTLKKAKNSATQAKTLKLKMFSVPGLGNQSYGLGTTDKKSKTGLYQLAWRHANTILSVFYWGPSSFSLPSLVQIAKQDDGRVS